MRISPVVHVYWTHYPTKEISLFIMELSYHSSLIHRGNCEYPRSITLFPEYTVCTHPLPQFVFPSTRNGQVVFRVHLPDTISSPSSPCRTKGPLQHNNLTFHCKLKQTWWNIYLKFTSQVFLAIASCLSSYRGQYTLNTILDTFHNSLYFFSLNSSTTSVCSSLI